MSSFPSQESISVKKTDNTPPDVYPQKPKQKEDEMTESIVRAGFVYCKPVREEYESCASDYKHLKEEDLWNLYYNILSRKYSSGKVTELRVNQVTAARTVNYDKSKFTPANFYRDLAGQTPLYILSRRAPYAICRKEEALEQFVFHKVPVRRAAWFINLNLLHSAAQTESVRKKKCAPSIDYNSEWSSRLCERMQRLFDTDLAGSSLDDVLEDWDYLFNLLLFLYDTHVSDHWEILHWLLDTIETLFHPFRLEAEQATARLHVLKFMVPYLLRFGRRWTESEIVVRRLAHWAAGSFALLIPKQTVNELDASHPHFTALLSEYRQMATCPAHRCVLFSLGGLLVSLCLAAPSAFVWSREPQRLPDQVQGVQYLSGSPLDLLPCPIAALPLAEGAENAHIRECLLQTEEAIVRRSKLVEAGWCPEQETASTLSSQSTGDSIAEEVELLARVLTLLDSYDFQSNSGGPTTMDSLAVSLAETVSGCPYRLRSCLRFLCEWAVTPFRAGLHRPVVTALLLDKLRDRCPASIATPALYQSSFLEFLDNSAPRRQGSGGGCSTRGLQHATVDGEAPFKLLVCLFGELVDRQLFDYNDYIQYCIAHGHVDSSMRPLAGDHHASVPPDFSEDNLGSVEGPDSVRSDLAGPTRPHHHHHHSTLTHHMEYLCHFQVPQEESYASELNQRAQLLYGGSRVRDRAKSRLRKFVRDICKLFTRKTYLMDVVNGEMGGRRRRVCGVVGLSAGAAPSSGMGAGSSSASGIPGESASEPFTFAPLSTSGGGGGEESAPLAMDEIHDEVIMRFRTLSYHDMEAVITQCMPAFLRMLNGCASVEGGAASSKFLSVPGVVCLFFELIELSLNFVTLLATVAETLACLRSLGDVKTHCAQLYQATLCARIVGLLCKHQAVLMTMPDLQLRLFDDLVHQVQRVKNVANCSPIDRCILIYVDDLFKRSFTVQVNYPVYNQVHKQLAESFKKNKAAEGQCELRTELVVDPAQLMSEGAATFRSLAEGLQTDPQLRFTFVVKAVFLVCRANTPDKLQNVCELCIRATAQCNQLAAEWLGAFHALLAPKNFVLGFRQLVSLIELADQGVFENLATLVSTLLSYHYFTLCEFLCCVVNRALMLILNMAQTEAPDVHLENKVRCACFILHRLFAADCLPLVTRGSSATHDAPADTFDTGATSSPAAQSPATAAVASSISSAGSSSEWRRMVVSEPLLLNMVLQRAEVMHAHMDALKLLVLHSDLGQPSEEVALANPLMVDLEEALFGIEAVAAEDDTAAAQSNDNDSDLEMSAGAADLLDGEEELGSGRKRRRCTTQAAQLSAKRRKRRAQAAAAKKGRRGLTYRFVHVATKRFLDTGQLPSDTELASMRACDLAHFVARQICTTSWVRSTFSNLRPDFIFHKHVLMDKKLSESHARRILHMMYWPRDLSWVDVAKDESISQAMTVVLSNLNLWTLGYSQFEFDMLSRHIQQMNFERVMEQVARSLVQRYNTQACGWLSADAEGASYGASEGVPSVRFASSDPTWLLPSLVGRVHKVLRQQIVRQACDTLKGIRLFWRHRNVAEKERILLQNSVLLAHRPFFALLQVCASDSADLPELLCEQVEYFIQDAKETDDRVPDTLRTRHIMQECLTLRLQLIGHRMRMPIENDFATKWIPALAQLIIHGVCEPDSNQFLFYMVLDMLHNLFHFLLDRLGPQNKNLLATIKKVKKELIDKPLTAGLEHLRPLLLVARYPRLMYMYTLSPVVGSSSSAAGASSRSSSTDLAKRATGDVNSVGPGIRGFNLKRGFMVTRRDACRAYESLDPGKLHIFYTMYGAVFCEESGGLGTVDWLDACRLISHEHFLQMHRPAEAYLAPCLGMGVDDAVDRLFAKQPAMVEWDVQRQQQHLQQQDRKQALPVPPLQHQQQQPPHQPPPPQQQAMQQQMQRASVMHHFAGGSASVGPPNRTMGVPMHDALPPGYRVGPRGPDPAAAFRMIPPMRGPSRPHYPPAQQLQQPAQAQQTGSMVPMAGMMDYMGGQKMPPGRSGATGAAAGSTTPAKRKKSAARNKAASSKAAATVPSVASSAPGPVGAKVADMYTFSGANSNSGGSLGWAASDAVPMQRGPGPTANTKALHDHLVKRMYNTGGMPTDPSGNYAAQQQQQAQYGGAPVRGMPPNMGPRVPRPQQPQQGGPAPGQYGMSHGQSRPMHPHMYQQQSQPSQQHPQPIHMPEPPPYPSGAVNQQQRQRQMMQQQPPQHHMQYQQQAQPQQPQHPSGQSDMYSQNPYARYPQ